MNGDQHDFQPAVDLSPAGVVESQLPLGVINDIGPAWKTRPTRWKLTTCRLVAEDVANRCWLVTDVPTPVMS